MIYVFVFECCKGWAFRDSLFFSFLWGVFEGNKEAKDQLWSRLRSWGWWWHLEGWVGALKSAAFAMETIQNPDVI